MTLCQRNQRQDHATTKAHTRFTSASTECQSNLGEIPPGPVSRGVKLVSQSSCHPALLSHCLLKSHGVICNAWYKKELVHYRRHVCVLGALLNTDVYLGVIWLLLCSSTSNGCIPFWVLTRPGPWPFLTVFNRFWRFLTVFGPKIAD